MPNIWNREPVIERRIRQSPESPGHPVIFQLPKHPLFPSGSLVQANLQPPTSTATMSSNATTPAAAAATANQALIALLDRLNELLEQVLRSQSEEEKMRLSRTIVSQLNHAICSYRTVATYIPLCLLSMAAEIHRAQMGHLPGHPLYPMTLGPAPNITTPTAGATSVSVPQPAPVPAPAPPLLLPSIATLLAPNTTIGIPGGTNSGAVPGPSKPRKRQFSASPPCLVKKARKAAPKSRRILTDTDTDTDGIRIGNCKVKGRGNEKGKGKDKGKESGTQAQNSTRNMMKKKLPAVVITTRPIPPAKEKNVTDSEYQPEDDDEDQLEPRDDSQYKLKGEYHLSLLVGDLSGCSQMSSRPKEKNQSKSGYATRTDQPKVKGKAKHPHLQPIGAPLLPCERCTTMQLECESWVTKRDINTEHPSPIPEEPDVNVEMDTVVTTPGRPSTTPDAAPVVSEHDFPVDQWIKPMDDRLLASSAIHGHAGQYPGTRPSIRLALNDPPLLLQLSYPFSPTSVVPLTTLEMDAMLAQLQIDMDQLCTRDDMIHDDLSNRIDRLHANYTQQLNTQKGLVDHLAVQMGSIAQYLRDNQRNTAATTSTPPAFNPPPIVIPGTPIFPEFGSISALGRAVTNNVFTPDVFSTNARPSGDGSPVTRHEQAHASASTSTSTSTINPIPTMVVSAPLIHPVGLLPVPPLPVGAHPVPPPLVGAHPVPPLPVGAPPVPPLTVPMESMPSTSTLHTLVTGPSNAPEDGQSISAPLPNRSFAPQSRQGRSVSARHAKNTSGNAPK
ncbi:uncharacterized protein F5147DRAFT_654221 [Suillus discolor]|uniref:Uncharacterized protein n=1 Tax=Suillus discolor TaxID=1912936 RepID=A0A9P7JSF9_9AGAM|nr:uncharacterized protein F5147DRAFT_654221 [Suillus discolor]KAG2105022.1 hypothetical protein F5147DRAFT_654221 [Suillus discolor]